MLYGIGKRLRDLRLEKNLSIDMLVADMNQKYVIELSKPLNKSMVSRWENDLNNPTLDNAKLLAEYYDVSLDYIIGLTDVKTPLRLMVYAAAIRKARDNKGGNK